ncbi:MAG: sensor histidine kinase [Candidatus Acidiferrales bacterium]
MAHAAEGVASALAPERHLSCLRDITERRRAEDSLHQLAQRLLTMQDEERRRIARELHDSTGQCLAATILNLEFVSRDEAALGPRARKALHDAIAHATTCAGEVRAISYLLHPPMLDEAGLAAALRWYVAGFGERSGVAVQLDLPQNLDRLQPRLRTALFRIVQEALTNIHRHAGSPSAQVRVVIEDNSLVLQVSDQGRGMPAEILSDPGGIRGLGVGLAGMHERVRQFGGELGIKSGNSGTTVVAKFPLEVSDGDPASAGRGRS